MADEKYLLVDQEIICREEEWDDVLLFDPESGVIKVTNHTGYLIWQLCDGTHTRGEVLDALQSAFDGVDEEILASDLDAFLADLESQGLVTYTER
jgi:hypothetical protein